MVWIHCTPRRLIVAADANTPDVDQCESPRPSSWPPPDDHPIIISTGGKVECRYGDDTWDLSLWAKKPLRLSFRNSKKGSGAVSIDNAVLFRRIVAWWLWGRHPIANVRTLKARFADLTPLFVTCSDEGILASDLHRYPRLIERIASEQRPSSAGDLISILHSLHLDRDEIGFTLLDESGIRLISRILPNHEARQTPYIPSRIWLYQVERLRSFLDDFEANADRLEDFYLFCLKSYVDYYGSIENASLPISVRRGRGPFSFAMCGSGATKSGYLGPFSEFATRYGVDRLLSRWLLVPGESLDGPGRGMVMLSSYFTMLGKVGIAYVVNHTMMRIEEAWSLRCGCLTIERDERFGDVYLLRGETTKTVAEENSYWVASPSVRVAIDALQRVSRLRLLAAQGNPSVPVGEQAQDHYLVPRHYEPWGNAKNSHQPLSVRQQYASYRDVVRNYPQLFNPDELRITANDLAEAMSITPDLDRDGYSIGRIWPLSWHQLRRTGAVNLQASGVVSDSSVQYQLKHASRAMSLYYGQGYSRVRLDERTRTRYVRAMYESMAREVSAWTEGDFISPHGEARKAQITGLVSVSDRSELVAAAREGRVAWRDTLLGGCTRPGPCEYGGIDNIVRCSGGDGHSPCVDALYDRRKEPALRMLLRQIDARLIDEAPGTPYQQSLQAQKRGVEHVLESIR